ncbi:hypothetical protein [Streptomyces prasinus]|uniref:hypothetical protein n=1 Tax=Streptomyces prasinus TaxID=67345 RepID=UPI0033F32656
MAFTVEAVEEQKEIVGELFEVGRAGVGRHVTHGFAYGSSGSALHCKTHVAEIPRQVRGRPKSLSAGKCLVAGW